MIVFFFFLGKGAVGVSLANSRRSVAKVCKTATRGENGNNRPRIQINIDIDR